MKRIVFVALCLVFTLALALPVFAQGGENKDWQEIQDQSDARRKAELIQTFIGRYSTSANRPDADKILVAYWMSNKDFAKVVQFADGFKVSLPSADNQSKGVIYSQGMMAALSLNNASKTKEFGEFAIAADPKNFLALSIMASSGLLDQKTSIDYAKKATELPKPRDMVQSQYDSLMTRNKNLSSAPAAGAAAPGGGANAAVKAAQDLMTAKKYTEAIAAYGDILKQNPKDQGVQFQHALANYYLMADSAKEVQNANDDQIKALSEKNNAEAAKAAAKQEQLTKVTMDARDAALEAFGKTVAIGGPSTAEAKKVLDALYQNKKGDLNGLDQFIADKKKELGVTDAPAAPATAPKR
jgi:hypothetical protein